MIRSAVEQPLAHPGGTGLGRLHVIVDLGPPADRDLLGLVLDAGAPVVQLRIKGMDDRRRYDITASEVERCRATSAICIVNDRADLALATGADGWHGGATDLPVAVARDLLGPKAIIGGTARDPETARRLEGEGATYLGVGPAYRSSTKEGLPEPLGPASLAAIVEAVSIPVIAISGVTAERVPEILNSGAHGVAVIGAVRDAPDPASAVRELLRAVEVADA